MKRIAILSVFFMFGTISITLAQKPTIEALSKRASTFGTMVTINGSGFSETNRNNVVYFGAARAKVLTSSPFTLEVLVPLGTTHEQVSVTNMETNLTGYSDAKYLLAFNGTNIDPERLTQRTNIQEEAGLFDICLCDFNGDNYNDIASTNNQEKNTSITLYINKAGQNNGEIGFTRFDDNNLLIGEETRNITCGDLDGDGKKDLIVGKGGNIADRIFIFRNLSSNGSPDFSAPIEIFTNINTTRSGSRELKVHDLDNDGKPEIVMTDQRNNFVHVLKNRSSRGEINFPLDERYLIRGENIQLGLDIQDMNQDSKPDIIFGSNLGANIYIAINQSSTGSLAFSNPAKLTVNGNMVDLATGDFNLDGYPDIVVANYINNVYVLLNEGSSSGTAFSPPKYIETGRLPRGLDVGDINGDKRPDILIATFEPSESLTLLENRSTQGSLSLYQHSVGTAERQRNIRIGDLSGDGKPDITFTVEDLNKIGLIKNQHCVEAEITPLQPEPICGDNPSQLSATIAGNVSYIWQNTLTDDILNATAPKLDVLIPGEYQVIIESEQDDCSSASDPVTIQLGGNNLPPEPTIEAPEAVCENGTLVLEAGIVDGVEYFWQTPEGNIKKGQKLEIPNAQPKDGGRYGLVLRSYDGCRSDAATHIVNISSVPELSIASEQGVVFCEGSTNTLTTAQLDNGSYQWYRNAQPINGSDNYSYQAGSEGSYFVKFTNTTGCVGESNTVALEKVSKPVANFEAPGTACLNEQIGFANTSEVNPDVTVSYFWDFGDGSTSTEKSPSNAFMQAGSYTVLLKVSYGNSSCTDYYEQDITISNVEGINMLVDGEVYNDSEIEICDGTTLMLSVPDGVDNVTWSTGSTDSTIEVDSEGTYSVNAAVANNTCDSKDEIFVAVKPSPDVRVTESIIKIGKEESATLEATGAANYAWTPEENIDDPMLANPTVNPTKTTYYVVTGSNLNECTDTDSVQVIIEGDRNIKVEADKIFTPNNDAYNNVWEIHNLSAFENCEIVIMNRHGQTVYEAPQYNNDWDATQNGQQLPEGAYYYVLKCSRNEVHTGSFVVAR